MRVKISERYLLLAVVSILLSCYCLYASNPVDSPVRVSEPGILLLAAAVVGIIAGFKLIKAGVKRVKQ